MTIYKITESVVDLFISKMDKLTRKAAKLGIEYGYTLESTIEESYTNQDGITTFWNVYNYSVFGESPTINGYTFIAKIEEVELSDKGTINLIHSHNTEYDFTAYRDCTLTCEHCNINRNRKFYYLIQNTDTKESKMVGGNCLANYIHVKSAEEVAEFYSDTMLMMDEFAEEEEIKERGINRESTFSISEFLAYGVKVVNQCGYVSSSKAEETQKPSTKDSTLIEFYNPKSKIKITEEDKKNAESMVEYVKESLTAKLESSNDNLLSNYENNILTMVNTGRMKSSHAGYIVSIIPLYNRMMEVEIKKSVTVQSEFLGEVGNKITKVNAVVTAESKFENNYNGYTYLYRFNSNGNIITYFASRDLFLTVGDNVIINTATVKKHDVYNGVNQTVITRAKIEVLK